jgi:exonuclease VII small subunit
VVLGKNIPQLSFLNLLLGEAPAMRADVSLYQRLMSGDQLEAATMVVQRLKNLPAAEVYDELLIPALTYAKRDVGRDYLTVHDQRNVLDGVTESLQQAEGHLQKILASKDDSSETSISDPSSIALTVLKPIKILGCPAMDETDSLGLEMLRQLLNPQIWDLEATAVITLTSELVDRLIKDPPAVVCIAALPPSGLAHARYLCKRLREASPEMQIVVGRWGQKRNFKLERERLLQTGADFVTATLVETLKLLDSRLPLLPRERLTAAAGVR